MSAPLARRDFFALEAGEYLERLGRLAGGAQAPESDSLVRVARALRGAALMAGPPGYAIAAAAIENLAKSLRDGLVAWSAALAEQLGEAVATGKDLLRSIRSWSEDDIARCERMAAKLNALVGDPVRRFPSTEPRAASTQSAAVRAYIARETAALAATLDQAADAVDLLVPGSLTAVSQRLQPLRGLGALPGLSPLPELLEALDLTLALGARRGAWPPRAGRAFRAVSAALARMARDIAELGSTQSDSPEIVRATELLREAFADEQDVVPIGSLFARGDWEPIVRRGIPPHPPQPATDATVELVSLADRLRDAAAQLRAAHGSARALQLHSLVFWLRGLSLSPAVSGSVGNLLGRLDREAMAGRVLPAAQRVSALLERASRALTDAAERGAVAQLGDVLAPLCEELDRLAPGDLEAGPIVPIESLAPDTAAKVVPIESLVPDTAAEVVPIASLGYDIAPAYSAFEQSFSSYFRLARDSAVAGPGPVAQAPVSIQSLLYRGRRALERANLIRHELDAALRAQRELADMRGLLGELLDLVPLALDDER